MIIGGRTNARQGCAGTDTGNYMLYYGDDFFAANIELNDRPLDYAPGWSRNFRFRATISGHTVYFNIDSSFPPYWRSMSCKQDKNNMILSCIQDKKLRNFVLSTRQRALW